MPKQYQVLSPDGLAIGPKTYTSKTRAAIALAAWCERYEKQGYYSKADGERIPFDLLPDRCEIEQADPPKLPPDPEELNTERSDWAESAIAAFEQRTRTDRGDALCDLLADLGHWCDRHGVRFQNELRRGMNHYDEETSGEGTQFTDITLSAMP